MSPVDESIETKLYDSTFEKVQAPQAALPTAEETESVATGVWVWLVPSVLPLMLVGAAENESVAVGQVSTIVTVKVAVPAGPVCCGFAFAETVMVSEVPFFVTSVVRTLIDGVVEVGIVTPKEFALTV